MFRQNKRHKSDEPVLVETRETVQKLETQKRDLEDEIKEKNVVLENDKRQQKALANQPGGLSADAEKENCALLENITKEESELEALRKKLAFVNAKIEAASTVPKPANHPIPHPGPQSVKQAQMVSHGEVEIQPKQKTQTPKATPALSPVPIKWIEEVFKNGYEINKTNPANTVVTKKNSQADKDTRIDFTSDNKIKVANGTVQIYADIAAYAKKAYGDDAVITINNVSNLEVIVTAFRNAKIAFRSDNPKIQAEIDKILKPFEAAPSTQTTAANGATPAVNAAYAAGTATPGPQASASALAQQKPDGDARPAGVTNAASTTSSVAGDANAETNNPDENHKSGGFGM